MAGVTLRGIRKSFGDIEIIKGVDLDIRDHEFVVFVGPSGCGKSTLLRLIAGLEDISSGDLAIDGQKVNDLPPAERGIAMVFQSYALYPHMTVYENMAFGLKLAKTNKAEVERKVGDAAKVLQLEPLLKRKPKELSGGQRQRVAIGRAIVRNPKVFLFDEPLSNLDAALRVQMRIEIARLHNDLNATMIYVTHDQVEAMTLADKIVVLSAGRIEQVGSPLELYHHPDNLFVAGFIGSPKMNFIETTVTAADGATATVNLPGGGSVTVPVQQGRAKSGDKVTLGIRPEHMSVALGGATGPAFPGQVFVVERLGGETFLYLKTDAGMMTVQTEGDSRVKTNDQVSITFAAETCHLFDAQGQALQRAERHPMADLGREPAMAQA
ncbi:MULTISPECIES: ABC transporter ATP-binding protein [Inquilinus]|uniref:Multiple sugar transport system ATP-binding protein n=1 Tax=Inquilinus ginsengisoli TaxID=363840 RepID=A0ABU1JKA0_9PROT|nr:sn-glycerol-3-phosphate ABC transporter ATP-binding protein UgpC [Inquilinus ginsengisoli]MDR6288762.1 multiple sugar transport system ATP-binding protein [Inquilinus ginsengisoli]